jgi:GNAT superfamily N-acetyltransferase
MRAEDVPAAERISSTAFHELDLRTFQRSWPEPEPRAPERSQSWVDRTLHLLRTDPGGCWVAERDGEVVGFATSLVRELMWILATYAVKPGLQGQGIGTPLLEAALHHGRGCLRGMLNASQDVLALRRYRLAGFDLHPQMLLWGHVQRADLPAVRHVREGTAGDRELMDSVDRRTRGAAHGPDHEVLMRLFRLVVTDRPSAQGYAYLTPTGSTALLAATSRAAASVLMWEGLAASDPGVPVEIGHVSAANQWALDVATAARLEVHLRGFLALRRMEDPAPYIPHSSLR